MNESGTKLYFLLAAILLISIADELIAQQAPSSPQCAEEGSPWRDFDFFAGDWEVSDPETGQRYGRNTLVMSERGCLTMGRWINVNGGTGTSMNFYDPLKQQWRQIWQSAPAFTDQAGALDGQGRMQMEGRIYYHASGLTAPFKGTWTPMDPDRFIQEFWQYNAENEQWTLWFRGEYRRTGSQHKPPEEKEE